MGKRSTNIGTGAQSTLGETFLPEIYLWKRNKIQNSRMSHDICPQTIPVLGGGGGANAPLPPVCHAYVFESVHSEISVFVFQKSKVWYSTPLQKWDITPSDLLDHWFSQFLPPICGTVYLHTSPQHRHWRSSGSVSRLFFSGVPIRT